MTFEEAVRQMHMCEQTKGLSVYQHGKMVSVFLFKFIEILNGEKPDPDFKIPAWFDAYKDQIKDNLYSEEILELYTVFHDIGKPFCLEIDSDGKRHFPNHAEVSKQVWQSISDNQIVADLIGDDMIIHTASAIEIDEYLKKWDIKYAITLLLTSLAEIHANASMFGGIESISFKMKFKQVEKRGNQICKYLFKK